MPTKICPVCNDPFETENPRRITCSPYCQRRHTSWQRHETAICPVCGKEFIPSKRSDRPQRTCSTSCGAILRARTETPEQRQTCSTPLPPIIVKCRTCGKEFIDKRRKKNRIYCSKRCSSKATAGSNKGWVPDAGWREKVSARMKTHNPSQIPEAREKMNLALRGRSFSGPRGGNGQVTPQQTTLATELGAGWEIEFPISNHHTNWKVLVVDIGHPRYKVTVEVDDASHRSKKQRTRDALKSDSLHVQGWQVIRFWNSKVD